MQKNVNKYDKFPIELEFIELYLLQNNFEAGNIHEDFIEWSNEDNVIRVPKIPLITMNQVKILLECAKLNYAEFTYFLTTMNEFDAKRLLETKRNYFSPR